MNVVSPKTGPETRPIMMAHKIVTLRIDHDFLFTTILLFLSSHIVHRLLVSATQDSEHAPFLSYRAVRGGSELFCHVAAKLWEHGNNENRAIVDIYVL